MHRAALGLADPSGGTWKLEQKTMRQISSGAATAISVGLNFIPFCQAWCSAAFNAIYAMHNGASDGDILFSAAVGYVGGEIGGAIGGGSRIAAGAISGAFSGMMYTARYGGNMSRAMVQGAVHGAAGAAIVTGIEMAVSSAMQPKAPTRPEVPVDPQGANPFDTAREAGQVAGPAFDVKGPGMPYKDAAKSRDAALESVHRAGNMGDGNEHSSRLYTDGESHYYSPLRTDGSSKNVGAPPVPEGYTGEGVVHNHPGKPPQWLSDDDLEWADTNKEPVYMIDSSRKVDRYTPVAPYEPKSGKYEVIKNDGRGF